MAKTKLADDETMVIDGDTKSLLGHDDELVRFETRKKKKNIAPKNKNKTGVMNVMTIVRLQIENIIFI